MKAIVKFLFYLWFAMYELIFVAIALLTKLNPYVLAALFIVGNGCNILYANMNKLSPYERPMAYNSEIFTSALCGIGFFSYIPIGVCFFFDWKIALIGLVVGLFLGGFFTFIANGLIVKPLFALYSMLGRMADKLD